MDAALQRILKALGASDEHEALRMVSDANEFMANVATATGCTQYSAALTIIRDDRSFTREVLTITSKEERSAALGSVLAFKVSHEALPGVQTRVTELEEEGRKRDVSTLINMALSTEPPSAQNPHAGKLTPASAKFWENEPASKLESFLKASTRVIPSSDKKPGAASGTAETNGSGALTNAENKTFEELTPNARAALQKSDPDLYETLRADWISRGRPSTPKTAA